MTDKRFEALNNIIRNKHTSTVFQPVISLMDGSVLGHEALSRITCDIEIEDIAMLFEVAGQHHKLWDLEQLCIQPNNVIFEITERNPNYIKMDMDLIRGVDKDSLKYALVKGMLELLKISNIYLIAEGIETFEELETLVNLGVQYGQGYYIQKPEPDIKMISSEIVETIMELNLKRRSMLNLDTSGSIIKNLSTSTHTLTPDEKIINVYSLLKQNPDSAGVCIVEDAIPVGIIAKEKLEIKLSGKYGTDLRQNGIVRQIMDKDFLAVDCKTAVNIVCTRAMARANDKIYDFIVVTENGKYLGTVTIKDLLLKAY